MMRWIWIGVLLRSLSHYLVMFPVTVFMSSFCPISVVYEYQFSRPKSNENTNKKPFNKHCSLREWFTVNSYLTSVDTLHFHRNFFFLFIAGFFAKLCQIKKQVDNNWDMKFFFFNIASPADGDGHSHDACSRFDVRKILYSICDTNTGRSRPTKKKEKGAKRTGC